MFCMKHLQALTELKWTSTVSLFQILITRSRKKEAQTIVFIK